MHDYRNFISGNSQNTDHLLLLSLKDMDSILGKLVNDFKYIHVKQNLFFSGSGTRLFSRGL